MKTALYYYDIYPKTVPVNKKSEITVKPLGRQSAFVNDSYIVTVVPMFESVSNIKDGAYPSYNVSPSCGSLKFTHDFGGEQQYCVRIADIEKKEITRLFVYALEPDYYGLIPLRGDLHAHTFHSDGKESPEIVAAYYRKNGFDFLSITDHHRYSPSLEAIDAYKNVEIGLSLIPGEEVHPPENRTHTVNFGGSFSVNDIIKSDKEKYFAEINALKEKQNIPEHLNGLEYASLCWVYDKIREGGGMAIFVHPHWIEGSAYHIRNDMLRYLFETKPFDAYELTGGQTVTENNLQYAFHNECRLQGIDVPIVGSSDSHGVINAEWFNISKTLVLAKSSGKDDIISAVLAKRSCALEQYAGEAFPRIHGSFRMTCYAQFLLENYFPLHDDLCHEEGRLMADYVNGVEGAGEQLNKISGRVTEMIKKYFC